MDRIQHDIYRNRSHYYLICTSWIHYATEGYLMIYVIDKSLKKLPYISTAKAGSFTATFGKLLYKEVQKEMWIYNIINSMHCFWFLVLFSNWWISRFYDHLYFLLFNYMGYIKYL